MKKLFDRCTKANNTIYVVSVLPRSGTAMMMQLLEAGGLSPVTDNERTAAADNRKGYYEFAPVKHLLPYLPADYNYKVVFMRRDVRGETHTGDREHHGGGADLEACDLSQTPWPARERE